MSVLNDAALCLMVSIGHRTGLFEGMSKSGGGTSQEIAAQSGLNERYVREWLGAMVTGGIIEADPETKTFQLPPEHSAFLTPAAGADNLAVFAQYIPLLGNVEDDILECFKNGGGVPYEKYPRFHSVMAEDSGQSVLSSLESHILPLVPGLRDRLLAGVRFLDVGCGRGKVINRLAALFPSSQFTGMDLSVEATTYAREEAENAGLKNTEFIARDLSDFDQTAEPESYDVVTTFDAVHDQSRPFNVLKGIHRTLKPDGTYVMQDIRASSEIHKNIGHPIGTFLYTVSCLHCMTVSLAQGGEGLGAMWGEEKTREYVTRAGFRSVETHQLAHDIQNNWYIIRK
ncbi:class I SAM-dependent methyltransferase [bacterium]|nr:class I SAM-dependent methyltransferase [bacterium]MCI0604559.1 class I SAM-dependent methyltransferase [bacterium]